jgi:hypothetical protein
LLAKESDPSLRFTQTPAACAEADLIMVVPWVLSNVISGRPKIYGSFIESARYAAEFRNFHWQNLRETRTDSSIHMPSGISPYPSKTTASTDTPLADKGGNFGRVARTGLMDTYMERIKTTPLCGIKALYWLDFFKIFQQDATGKDITLALEKLKSRISGEEPITPRVDRAEMMRVINTLERILFA